MTDRNRRLHGMGRTPNHHRTGLIGDDYPIDPYRADAANAYDPYDRYWRTPNGKVTLYHCTLTKSVPKIIKKGILPMQRSNWVVSGTGERYGGGFIFAFEDYKDAVSWAMKWDWMLNSNLGTGDISIVEFVTDDDNWVVDDADPISQFGARGKWLKSQKRVLPEDILGSTEVTNDVLRSRKPNPARQNYAELTLESGEVIQVRAGDMLTIDPYMTLDRSLKRSKRKVARATKTRIHLLDGVSYVVKTLKEYTGDTTYDVPETIIVAVNGKTVIGANDDLFE
jgi:hypothetical protein